MKVDNKIKSKSVISKTSILIMLVQMIVISVIFSTLQAEAHSWAETDYILDYNYDIPFQIIPKSYTHVNTIFYLGDDHGTMSLPSDIFIDDDDNLFVADSVNNRIIKRHPNRIVSN